MTKDAKNLIVGLDIGTSKIVAVVAEVMPDGRHEVIGLGQHESKGLKKGVVVNIESTVESIQRALKEAELMKERLERFPGAYENTQKIADRCDVKFKFNLPQSGIYPTL